MYGGGRRWQVGGRRGDRLADDGPVVQQGVEGLVVQGAHDGGDELLDLGRHPVQDGPAGVRPTRRGGGRPGCAAASAGRLARPQGCGAAHRVFVAWPPQRQRRQLVAPGLEPAVTSSFHPLKEANTSPFSRSGTLK
jgi:hypothetical protein